MDRELEDRLKSLAVERLRTIASGVEDRTTELTAMSLAHYLESGPNDLVPDDETAIGAWDMLRFLIEAHVDIGGEMGPNREGRA
jgi:hypothetical protein